MTTRTADGFAAAKQPLTRIEELQARVAGYEREVEEAEPYVPDLLRARLDTARAELEQATETAAVNLKDLQQRYGDRMVDFEQARVAHVKAMEKIIKTTDDLIRATEGAKAAARLLRSEGETAPIPIPLTAQQAYEMRTLISDFHAAARRAF